MRLTDLHNQSFDRILLIKPSAVGDVTHTLPVLAKLRQRYPSARIDWMLTPGIAELVRHHPALSNVVLFARHEYGRSWRSWSSLRGLIEMVSELRGARYDLVIDLHGQFRSAFFSLATGAPTRIGFDRPRHPVRRAGRELPREVYAHAWTGARELSWLAYTHRIRIPTLDSHAIDRYLWLGEMLGLAPGPPDLTIPIPPEADAAIERLLRQYEMAHRRIALLTPGTIWETKHWPAQSFAQVANHLLASGWGVVLAGSSNDRAICTKVAAAAPGVADLSGRTSVSELAALIQRSGLCVTNDSGPMHLAAALGTPLVSIFGPTDPIWIGPYGRADSVVRVELPCSPCYLRRLRDCPHDHACMKGVTPGMVIERIETLLHGTPLRTPTALATA